MDTRKQVIPTDHPDGTRTVVILEKDLDGDTVSESILESTGKQPILRLEGEWTEHLLPFPRKQS